MIARRDFHIIPGFKNYYAAGDGRIYSFSTGRYRQLTEFRYPYARYLIVYIRKNKIRIGAHCHKLVASAFFGINPDLYDIKHINKDRCNNKPSNLQLIPLNDIQRSELENFYRVQIREYEIMLLYHINFNYDHPDYLKLCELKKKNNLKLLYNYLNLLINSIYKL
jgi:hypothetical protein